jgi:DNA-binding FadR family transcriptional regulator
LYEAYNKQFKASERTLRDAIRHLEQLKLITAELQENKGKTRILKLAIGKDAVEEL